MALTRKFLSALGIDADKIDEIISAHTDTVDGLKAEIETLKQDVTKLEGEAKELKQTKNSLETVQKELNELKENKDVSKLEAKYEALKSEYDTYKKDTEAKAVRAKKEDAYKTLLADAKIPEKRFGSIIKLSGDCIDKIEFGEDETVSNKDDIMKTISEEWSEYIPTVEEQGANVANPPANNGGNDNKISRARQIAQQYHDDLYGKIKED